MMNYSALFFLLTLAGATLGEVQKRVIEGKDCGHDEGLHHVVLTVINNNEPNRTHYHCGGSLIGNEWVLTAAHCNKTNLVALLNRHLDTRNEQIGEITDTIQYRDDHGLHDIMLLKLNKSFPELPRVPLPIKSTCQTPTPKTPVRFYGWFTADTTSYGNKKEKSRRTEKLQCGDLEVADCGDLSIYKESKDLRLQSYSYSRLLCAHDPSKKDDSCKGDSGGSLITKDGRLHGVLSGSSHLYCWNPVRFMDVCQYRSWINDKTSL